MTRYRQSTREWCFDFHTFSKLDFGKVCAQLGLRPSKPNRPAAR